MKLFCKDNISLNKKIEIQSENYKTNQNCYNNPCISFIKASYASPCTAPVPCCLLTERAGGAVAPSFAVTVKGWVGFIRPLVDLG